MQRFDAKIKFVILIHPIENRRRIASGRMASLCLENSELILGQDYTRDQRVNEILDNPENQCFVLYPGPSSLNLTGASRLEKAKLFTARKQVVIFVVDGTWATARNAIRDSKNLIGLPRLCFTPPGPSRFRVRYQPGADCYSTIEAVHHTIELLGEYTGFNVESRLHDRLMHAFDKMIDRQYGYVREYYLNPNSTSYRKRRPRLA